MRLWAFFSGLYVLNCQDFFLKSLDLVHSSTCSQGTCSKSINNSWLGVDRLAEESTGPWGPMTNRWTSEGGKHNSHINWNSEQIEDKILLRLDSVISGIIYCMRTANERRCYNVTSSPIGWVHAQDDLCYIWINLSTKKIKVKAWSFMCQFKFCYIQ